ncbi:MAG: hypothetical protein WD267_00685 [Balneolales bacterium]
MVFQSILRSAYLGGFCLLLMSCSLFDTRDPEDPGQGNGSLFIQPDRANDVIDNLINAVENLNQLNYLRCLSDNIFEYIPTSQAQNNAPELWESWSKQDEEAYFNNMRAAAENFSGHQLQFQNEDFSPSGNTTLFTADYSLTIIHNQSSAQGNIPSVVTGSVIISLRAEDGLWVIESWSDASDSNSPSWSDMRATFR